MYHHLATAESEDYQVTHTLCDGEKGFTAFFNALRTAGYLINPAGPGQHVPVVERKIRVVKERLRWTSSPTHKGKTLQAHMNYSEVRRSIINDNCVYHSAITRNAMTHMLPQIPWSVEQTRASRSSHCRTPKAHIYFVISKQDAHAYAIRGQNYFFQQTS